MKTYLIGYDLNKEGQNYEGLVEKIKETFGTWWHHLDSTWIVKSNLSAAQIRDILRPFIDNNDELLVASLAGESAWVGFNEPGSKWLKENIEPTQ
jgi:hypothetical protein